jgi:uncharacterized membrane protein
MTKTLTVLIIVLCLAGVVVSALAYAEHYNTKPAPCDINEKWDCGIVNHSPYAVVHDVQVELVGILGYAVLASLAGRLPWMTALLALMAFIFALRLTWIEWKTLGVWCVYCVSSQAIITAVLLLSWIAVIVVLRTHRHI